MNFLENYTKKIDKGLKEINLPEKPNNLYDPLRYFFALGGKRIRPILTLLAAEKFTAKDSRINALDAALAVEVFHNFSLVHDDIMDEAPVRRGRPTVHTKWDANIAILSGDVMLVKAYQYLNNYPAEVSKKLIDVFNKTAIEVCEGQQMDMDFEKRVLVEQDEYLKMISLKTSVLLGCALQLGAIVGGADLKAQNELYQFGLNMGVAFQIQDDILDLYGDSTLVGKQVGGDIIANKNTLLMILARQEANEKQLSSLEVLLKGVDNNKKIEGIITLFESLNVKEKCQDLMNVFYKKAEKHLQEIELKDEQSGLWALISLLKKRSY
ncbi:polyprenyl synthetase family protein [Crocinitomicaceae bacterium]|nr:polyprenyl synthetase family protein [Crocinitomicaceae bacterium]